LKISPIRVAKSRKKTRKRCKQVFSEGLSWAGLSGGGRGGGDAKKCFDRSIRVLPGKKQKETARGTSNGGKGKGEIELESRTDAKEKVKNIL